FSLSSGDSTIPGGIRAMESVWRSARRLSMVWEDAFGWSPKPARGPPSSSRCRRSFRTKPLRRSMLQKTIRVLLIEDDPQVSELIGRWLAAEKKAHFELERFGELQTGLERLKSYHFDVLF